jgi:hypothetical protein
MLFSKQSGRSPKELTSETTSEIVVEYRFQCFCGSPIVATEKTAACANCGEILGIHRKRTHRRWYIAWRQGPYRKLQLEDLEELAIRIALYFFSGYYVYDLLHY